jgi:hypothetical protein
MSPLSGTSARTGLLRWTTHALAAVGGCAVAGIIAVTVGDVVGRQVGLPVKGAYDLCGAGGEIAMVWALPLTKASRGTSPSSKSSRS